MPLTEKGNKIKSSMEKEYGEKKGQQVFYASKEKGAITGVDEDCWGKLCKGWGSDCNMSRDNEADLSGAEGMDCWPAMCKKW